MVQLTANEFERRVRQLAAFDTEQPWLEFKENNESPTEIGEYVSALANAAALGGHPKAYVIWGVEDGTRRLVGTDFDPSTKVVGGEAFENWLLRMLEPEHHISFQRGSFDGKAFCLLTIDPAVFRPVYFQHVGYIRVGSYKKKLKDHPDHERRLWRTFESASVEDVVAIDRMDPADAISLLDHVAYFNMTHQPVPESRSLVIEQFEAVGFLKVYDTGECAITNLGALLFAKDLHSFPSLARKAARVITYKSDTRAETIREQEGRRGYAAAFQGLFDYIDARLPESEVIDRALRRADTPFPQLAVRELVANALIHQDLTLHGTGPTIEVFSDRVEITNPGAPLIDSLRFIDSPPISRNEKLARMMRTLGICEERGSGWDKVALEVELHQLPAPLIEVTSLHTRVVLLAPRRLRDMDADDRNRAVYFHTVISWVNRKKVTNASIRARFGLADSANATASRALRDAVEAGLIVPYDRSVGPRALRYVPFWADTASSRPV